MKKILALLLTMCMIFSFAACGEKAQAKCEHEYVAVVSGEGKDAKVVLTCSKCGEAASAAVEIAEKIVEKEVPVEVEKEVIKTVTKEVEKIVEKEVPVYASLEEQMMAEDYETLGYYITNYSKLNAIKEYVLENFYIDIDDETLMQGVYDGLFEALDDPYSEYVPASEAEEYYDALSNSYSGIGITMMADENGNARIESVTVDSPAQAAGLLPGDVISAVDGKSVLGMGLDAAEYVRGEAGTTVTLTIIRNGSTKTVLVTRKKIGMPTVDVAVLDENIGYIAVSGFDGVTNAELKAALNELESKGIKKFVLDLRDNGGGDVDVAIAVADQLMNAGNLCYTMNRAGDKDYYKLNAGRTAMKYVVLVNEHTASAAEILAAGMQDNNEAKLVGKTTYGKGVIQLLLYVNDGSSFKLTEYQYFSPKGKTINKVGVKPDYEVDLTNDCFDADGYLINDLQLEKAVELLK